MLKLYFRIAAAMVPSARVKAGSTLSRSEDGVSALP
jgi:hypothetical protein